MKALFCWTLVFFSLTIHAETYEAVNARYAYEGIPEYQAIMNALRPYGGASPLEPKEKTETKVLSRGERAVEEAKARNRAILAARARAEKQPRKGETVLEQWKREEKDTLESWKKESADTLKTWKKEQDIFLGRIKVYQENTFEIPAPKIEVKERPVPMEDLPQVHIVNEAFAVPVRDQWNRPTCSAFAGVRAMEILLAQNKAKDELSPQYFYWASKPKCHTSPCSQKGSWVTPALTFSERQAEADIPHDSSCAYGKEGVTGNETQVPLSQGCHEGKVKVLAHGEVKTLAEAVEKIKGDLPVVMAAKLSPNFYKNKGLVTLADAQKLAQTMDAHAMGHAFLGVGVVELPKSLRETEGHYCIIVANSWGQGWGAGGYSCLTEKWLMKYRRPSSFVTINRISVK